MNERTPATAWVAIGCATLCTAFLAFFTPLPAVEDERLALPIARAAADSSLYPSTDLLVSSGLRGPFHLYRLAGALYANGMNVDVWWYALLIASLFATFVAIWHLAHRVTGTRWLAALVVATVAAASPYRGTAHWFLLPAPNFVTSTLATPAAVAALALAISGRAGWGLVVAALTFNVHPAIGLLTAVVIAVQMLAARSMSRRSMMGWWLAAAICAAPNVLFIVLNAPGNFTLAPSSSLLTFSEQFRLYAHHSFVTDHWRENYGWFVLQIAGIVALRRHLVTAPQRAAKVVAAAFMAIAIAWFGNLYTINYPAVTLSFAVRGVAFLKPVAFAAVAAGLAAWTVGVTGRARVLRMVAGAILLAGALHKNLDIGEGMAAIAWGSVMLLSGNVPRIRLLVALPLIGAGLGQVLGQGWSVVGVARFSPEGLDAVRLATIVSAGLFLLWAAIRPLVPEPVEAHAAADGGGIRPFALRDRGAAFALATAACVLVTALFMRGRMIRVLPSSPATIARAMRLAEPDTAVADFVRWAPRGSPAGSLFALPPTDGRFTAFRLAAGRGVFATVGDVHQLAYDAAQYGAAHARLVAQGMRLPAPHAYDGSAWDTLGADRIRALAKAGVDYAVFGAPARAARPLDFPVVFRDVRWIVYDIRSER